MTYIENEDGSWIKSELKNKVLEYTDSDGVWMKETYNEEGNIVSRKNSFGDWDKFEYVKVAGESKHKVIHTKGTKGQ
jgi:hypothetical protein